MTSPREPIWLVCVTFAAFGAYFGALAVSLADIEKALGVSHGVFGLMMGLALLGGGCSSALVSVRAHRKGVGRTMREALVIWAALLAVAIFVPSSSVIAVLLVAAMGIGAAVDVVMNTVATQSVQASPSGLLRIHSIYNLGAAAGAGGAGAIVAMHHDWRLVWTIIAVVAAALAFADWGYYDVADTAKASPASSARTLADVGNGTDDLDHVPLHASLMALVHERVLLAAAAFVLGAMIEGGVDAWGPLYLRTDLESGVSKGALATAVGYLIGFAGRMAMSVLARRWGAKWCALFGTATSGIGLLLLVSAPTTAFAAIGLALAIGGITTNWPLLISYATENNPNAALITGGMSTAGYAGLVVSPAVLGGIAGLFGLRSSLATLAACAVLVILLLSLMPRRHTVVKRA